MFGLSYDVTNNWHIILHHIFIAFCNCILATWMPLNVRSSSHFIVVFKVAVCIICLREKIKTRLRRRRNAGKVHINMYTRVLYYIKCLFRDGKLYVLCVSGAQSSADGWTCRRQTLTDRLTHWRRRLEPSPRRTRMCAHWRINFHTVCLS